ncbi:MAG: flagellin [Methanomicrobiales archaeon]
MSSETIVTALFLIAAVVAAGVLINAIFPVISRTTETFGSVSHTADTQIRTDIKIVNEFANSSESQIWLKNIGTARIPKNDLDDSDIFFGNSGNFGVVSGAALYPLGSNPGWWNPGETLLVVIKQNQVPPSRWPSSGNMTYFAIVLPNGVKRSIEFVAD